MRGTLKVMGPELKLMLLFAALHLLALGLAGGLLVMFLRSQTVTAWTPPDEDGGGGGGDSDRLRPEPPTRPPDGGPPLPDAQPARVRLRQRVRLADLLPRPGRRPCRAPERDPARRLTPT